MKECARVADYKIPQAAEKDKEIPKNDKGEDLGIGDGWWYKGKSYDARTSPLIDLVIRIRNGSYI